MDMIRWLLGNKVVQVVWGLGILAVLLSWIFGGSKADHAVADADTQAKVEQVAEAHSANDADEKTVTATEEVTQDVAEESDVKTDVAAGAAAVATTVVAAQALADNSQENVDAAKEEIAPADQVVSETVAETVEVEEEVNTEKAAVTEETKAGEVAVVTEETEANTEVAEVAGDTKTAEAAVAVEEVKEVAAVTEEVKTEEVVATDGLAEKSSDDLLMMAREAYWNNGLDEAAELYSALIEREPTVIEHKGELGNVFWRQGFPKKAAELYADIAEPMIAKGNGERVSNMVGFIGLFFPERAASIRELLNK